MRPGLFLRLHASDAPLRVTSIAAPLTIYVDESGKPDYRIPGPGDRPKAYVVCAVSIHAADEAHLLAALPRDGVGSLLKHSQIKDDSAICAFLDRLFRSRAEIGAIQIDPGSTQSIHAATANTDMVNERRRMVGHREVKPPTLTYTLLAARAIPLALYQAMLRTGSRPRFFDVFMDRANLAKEHEDQFRRMLQETMLAHEMTLGQLDWKTEQDCPMLVVPDIVGGALHRRGVGHLTEPGRMLLRAERQGRIMVSDGWRLNDPLG